LILRLGDGDWFSMEQSPLIMSKKMASIIMAYGGVLAALGFVVRSLAPELANIPFLIGLVGGGLCLLFGLVALIGLQRRVWTILTLVIIALTDLGQVVPAWMSLSEKPGTLAGALLLTLMLLLTVGMLMYLLHGERTPEFYKREPVRPDGLADGGKQPSRPAR
jgi:peptidoglycan/LPS O-acetylase OafA/YrhL